MNLKSVALWVGVALAIVLAGVSFFRPQQAPPLGATPGNDFFNQAYFHAGRVDGTLVATSSQGTAITLKAAELVNWANAGLVSDSPGLVADETLTLPASSTLKAFLPNAGDRQSFCIINATSTAAVNLILAGGTGTNLRVASSSATALGSLKIQTGDVGCITFVREAKTATSYDIDGLLTVFK